MDDDRTLRLVTLAVPPSFPEGVSVQNVTIDRERGTYTFEEEGKQYTFFSVTHVLGQEVADYSFVPEEVLYRGTYVHEATALLDGGGDGSGLNWDRVDPDYVGYVRAWERWTIEKEFVPLHIERPVRSLRFRFVGTMDRFGWMRAKGKRRVIVLPDIKTGDAVYPWEALQTAAYLGAYKEECSFDAEVVRYTIHLHKDGTYTPQRWDDPSDWPVFLSMLSVHNWKINKLKRRSV